jgi:hypothetical protein
MRILALPLDEILNEVKILENQVKQIKSDLLQTVWWMRGGMTYDEAHYLCNEEREMISAMVKENLETTKKTGMPFF